MSVASQYLTEWSDDDLVDPRGKKFVAEDAEVANVDAWPIKWSRRRVGLFSNKKPNADAMLDEVKRGLLAVAPDLAFVYGSKEPLAENAPSNVIDSLSSCDVVILASAECGGCTSWLCRDHITLEKRGIPCLTIATNRFEVLARGVLGMGGVKTPHLVIPKHPVSGIPPVQAQEKIRELMGRITGELFGASTRVSRIDRVNK